jgi:hypothetical protein
LFFALVAAERGDDHPAGGPDARVATFLYEILPDGRTL